MSPRKPAYAGFQIPEKAGKLRLVSRRFVRCVSRAGLSVAVWTVNEDADLRRLLEWGVDALITDRPDVATAIVRPEARGQGPETRGLKNGRERLTPRPMASGLWPVAYRVAVSFSAVTNFGSMSTGTSFSRSSTRCTSGRTTPSRFTISAAFS